MTSMKIQFFSIRVMLAPGCRLSLSLALCRGQVPLSNPTLQFLWSVGAGWMIVMITFRFFVGQVLMSVGCVWSPCCLRPKGVFGLALFLLCLHFGLVGCSGCVLIRCESLWHRVHCCCHVDFFFLSAILSLLPLSIHLWNALLGEQ